ncbi:ATP-grasp domain-containing protein [Streptomyces sp. NPDC058371]|uniref:ATP-grasp domain-containing protein n=1 Tax=Streptomyces sp. NPDC058371 TaxID=3346463 RepID=UPI003666AF60
MSSARRVVIVDAYGPTKPLAEEFRAAGVELVRVQSSPVVPALYPGEVDLADYVDDILHDGDLAATVARCRAYEPVAVVVGSEPGVELADALGAELGLVSNGVALSAARRDKYAMIETIRQAGLTTMRQIRSDSSEELFEWHRSIGGRVVVKPLRSTGNDGVYFCDTPQESVVAYDKVVGAVNLFSERNAAVVAQEYLRGTEYSVNTVSRDGRRHVTDMWRTSRISVNGVIDFASQVHLMRRRGEVQDQLADYAGRVLDALEIQHGPAHLDIKITDSGPALVEVGPRLCGGRIPSFTKRLLGESQLDLTVDAYLNPERFHERIGGDYPIGRHFAIVPMISPVEGTLRGYRHLDRIRGLESFHEVIVFIKPGEKIVPTVDDMTPLLVLLEHDNEETVLRDAGTINYLDGEGFYELEPETAVE